MMNVERHNGFEAWRRLKQEYEPNLPGRWATMLSSLISPSWTSDAMRWREEFQQWEVDLGRYEAQSGTAIPATIRIAVVARYSPAEVREGIRSDEGGAEFLAIGEANGDAGGAAGDVVVGEDVAGLLQEDPLHLLQHHLAQQQAQLAQHAQRPHLR